MTPTAVYRLYDTDGRLLYVGASGNPERRMRDHASEKPWWGRVARQAIEWYPTKAEALAAETAAIRNEFPEFNIQHATSPEALAAGETLVAWKRVHDRRDTLVRLAYDHSFQIMEIHQLSGIARTTVYKILGIKPGEK